LDVDSLRVELRADRPDPVGLAQFLGGRDRGTKGEFQRVPVKFLAAHGQRKERKEKTRQINCGATLMPWIAPAKPVGRIDSRLGAKFRPVADAEKAVC
jgi:hypothetical protein